MCKISIRPPRARRAIRPTLLNRMLFSLVACWLPTAAPGAAPAAPSGPAGPRLTTSATPCDSVPKFPTYNEVLFTKVSIDGGDAHATIPAGETFTVIVEFYVQDCIDPGFAKEVVIGFPHDPNPTCVFNQAITCTGATGADTITMTAPIFAGDYAIGFDVWEDPNAFVCSGSWTNGPPDPSRYIACVTVLPGNQPQITTGPATAVSGSAASLSGTVDPNGFTSDVRFAYGTSQSSYSDSVIAVGSPVSGSTAVPVSLNIGGLTANTRYYYTVSVTNINGVFHGPKLSFFTGPQFGMANPVRNIGKLPFNGNRVDSVTILNTGNMTLQLASVTSVNPLISVSPSSGSIPPLGSAKFQVTAFGLEYGTLQGDLIITHNATTTPDTQKVEAGVYSGTVQTGWNLVSVPLDAPNYAKTAIFPSSVSSASRYSNGYVTSTTLDNGIGYWLKFPAAESTVIDGAIRIRDTAFVAEGWNMIGTPTLPVPLDSISSSPPGIVASAYFRYTNSYQPASQLLPVQGYWVKADGAGMIIMRSRLTEMPPAAGHTGVEPGPAHGTGTIGITDAEGRRAELYTLAPGTPNTAFELPPAPPAGLFDARYHDGSYASAAAAGSGAPIEISSAAFPATVNWSFDDPSVVLLLNGSPAAGGPAGSVTLESSSDRIAVAQGGPRAVPHSFAVSHYPNPFNPAARIRYELPAKAHVRVVVFDALGREVEELYSGEREAGSWEVEFDASGRPSGVYLYRVIAGGEATGGKLLLVR